MQLKYNLLIITYAEVINLKIRLNIVDNHFFVFKKLSYVYPSKNMDSRIPDMTEVLESPV